MHDDRLRIYLADHAALAAGEAELAKRCRGENPDGPLGEFLVRLEGDLDVQRAALRDVLARVGGKESPLKDAAAWLGEKLGRLKLNDSLVSYSPLSRLVELEGLTATAAGRAGLWDALGQVAASDPRLGGVDFATLREQAKAHLGDLDAFRRQAAAAAFLDA